MFRTLHMYGLYREIKVFIFRRNALHLGTVFIILIYNVYFCYSCEIRGLKLILRCRLLCVLFIGMF